MEQTLMWLVPMWTLALALALALLPKGWLRSPARWLAAGMALVALVPWLPASHAEPPRKPVTQVVYRFDDHRYLELTGHGCEGSVDYVDEARKIRANVVSQYWRLYLGRYVHADHESGYVLVPYEDGSAFEVSIDNGKTFRTARWVGYYPYGFPGKDNVLAITVIDKQAFIETRDHRLAMTSKPFGKGWGMLVIDPVNELPTTVFAERPEFQHLPSKVPPVKNYKGWTEMHCDPDRQAEPVSTLGSKWNAFQKDVLAVLGNTVARPVTWAIRYINIRPTA